MSYIKDSSDIRIESTHSGVSRVDEHSERNRMNASVGKVQLTTSIEKSLAGCPGEPEYGYIGPNEPEKDQ